MIFSAGGKLRVYAFFVVEMGKFLKPLLGIRVRPKSLANRGVCLLCLQF
jgi:hypothetical protein